MTNAEAAEMIVDHQTLCPAIDRPLDPEPDR
jgi:hypothetical protein